MTVLDRDMLRDGTVHRIVAEAAARGLIRLMTDEEREASLAAALATVRDGDDIWIFGYGSLMWNPIIRHAEARSALVRGWHRRYCIWSATGRGSPHCPGLMLALERGGACRGMAFRVAAADREEEMRLLWRREMIGGSYRVRWVRADTQEGPVSALTFVINRAHPRYIGRLDPERIAAHVATAGGRLGSCLDYLSRTVAHLESLGVNKGPMHDILRRVHGYAGGPPRGYWQDGKWVSA